MNEKKEEALALTGRVLPNSPSLTRPTKLRRRRKVGETAEGSSTWPLVELTPVGEHEEPSLEHEAKRTRFEVDLKVEAASERGNRNGAATWRRTGGA